MSPQKEPHAATVSQAGRVVTDMFGSNYLVRQQLPIILHDQSEPEPDLAVVPGQPWDYLQSHPLAADVLLLIEVSDTTLRFDRERKQEAYSRAGVAEYWILNLRDRQLEVYRDPSEFGYRSVVVYGEDERVSPLHAPQAAVRVGDLLPPAGIG
jgi:Uma2 family endonuclease